MKLEDRFTVYKRYDQVQGVELTAIYDNLRSCEVTEQEAEQIVRNEYAPGIERGKEKAVDTKYKVVDCVPYQCCPVCNGTGSISTPLSSSTSEICTVCNGQKIIPMHIVETINMEAPKQEIIFGADFGSGQSIGVALEVNAKGDIIVGTDQ